jgi:preprotein translocase subunit YajC
MESLLRFFVSDAVAQATAPVGGASGLSALVLPALLIVVFYFLLIRPQQKKQKEHRVMLDALAAGNEVVTGGGVLGKVTDVGEHFVTVEVAPGVSVKVQKHSITAVVPKDTIKNA